MESYILEACVDSTESAIIASRAGANRLELCSNLIIGGTTPDVNLFNEIRKNCDTDIHVLIRPRFGDFCYSDYDVNIMENDIAMYNELGADGVVIGILKPNGQLNDNQMGRLIEKAGNMNVVLHRAFDMCINPKEALKNAKDIGISEVLTSGCRETALKGIGRLKELACIGKEEGISILMGAGINADSILQLYKETGNKRYHMSGKRIVESQMMYRNTNINMGLSSLSEYEIWQTDENKIMEAVKVLKNL